MWTVRAVCVHGHYYQPPREHPWLGVVEPEPSAAPDRDWNVRITRECYRPAAAARILDGDGRLQDLVDVYEWSSFDVGPTLLAWLGPHAPDVLAAMRQADAASRARTGHGNAWGQPYVHAILPLCRPDDVRTLVHWGRRDFVHHFGREPEGMWLPEMAVDRASLQALAEADVALTMLAPHQARRVRPLDGGDDAWRDVTAATLDTRRLYRVRLEHGRAIDVMFRDATLSAEVAFGQLLTDGATLAARLRANLAAAEGPVLVGVAVDGETYGHHHRFGEMALAFALRALAEDPGISVVGPAAFRAAHPPIDEVEIADDTSWSCSHGIERWRADCGCRGSDIPGWTQAWRTPLRGAIDWLTATLAATYRAAASEVLRDPDGARDRLIQVILDPSADESFLAAEAVRPPTPAAAVQARRALAMARHALFMQTSCGWFFDELSGIEPVLVLRHAARAIELAAALGQRLEDDFVQRLEPARSNVPEEGSGADVWRRHVRPVRVDPPRVATTGALLAVLGEVAEVPGHAVDLPADFAADGAARPVRVVELATGAATTVDVVATRVAPEAAPVCRAGDLAVGVGDLLPTQRERVLGHLGRATAEAARAGRRAAVGASRAVLQPLLDGDLLVPVPLAELYGREEAEAIAAAVREEPLRLGPVERRVAALRRRGLALPTAWLATQLEGALVERLAGLPGTAGDVAAVLDLATAAGVALDLLRARIALLSWWKRADGEVRRDATLTALCDRLGVAPRAQ